MGSRIYGRNTHRSRTCHITRSRLVLAKFRLCKWYTQFQQSFLSLRGNRKVALARTKKSNYGISTILRKGSFTERENKNLLIASHMKTEGAKNFVCHTWRKFDRILSIYKACTLVYIPVNWIKKLKCKN